MKKLIYPLMLTLALTACSKEETKPIANQESPEVNAKSQAQPDSKNKENKEKPRLTEDDIFYFPSWYMVKLEDGKLVNTEGSQQIDDGKVQYWDINFSDDYFVGRNTDDTDYKIYKIEGKDLRELYQFEEDEKFRPIGLAGDYIYGFHSIEKEANGEIIDDQFIGAYNTKTGEFSDFSKIKQESFGSAVVTDDKLIYQDIIASDEGLMTNEYTLKLDGNFDQEPISASQYNFISDMYSIRTIKDGVYDYQVLRTNEEGILAGEQTWPIPSEAEGRIKPFGKYMLKYSPSSSDTGFEFEQNLKIYDAYTGKLIHDINIRGQRFVENTLYYISTDNEIESIDLN